MKYKAVFDTNSIRNAESIETFLGNRDELERFLKVSEILIPEIVIDEIKIQKRKSLISKRDSFLANPFHSLRKIDKIKTASFDIEQYIKDLVVGETIPFTIIHLTRADVIEDIKKLCIGNIPPFDEGTDKGFKDTLIYFTILEYLDTEQSNNIFVITKDVRLKLAFGGNSKVIVVKNFDEFEKYIDTYFREEYFINRLKEVVSKNINSASIEEIWLNTEENWTIRLSCDDKIYFIEVDFSSREIIDFTDYNFSEGITELIASHAYVNTHHYIELIRSYVRYFSDEQIQNLIEAATTNDQINSIASDEDVKEFFLPLFKSKSQIISSEIKHDFNKLYLTQ